MSWDLMHLRLSYSMHKDHTGGPGSEVPEITYSDQICSSSMMLHLVDHSEHQACT